MTFSLWSTAAAWSDGEFRRRSAVALSGLAIGLARYSAFLAAFTPTQARMTAGLIERVTKLLAKVRERSTLCSWSPSTLSSKGRVVFFENSRAISIPVTLALVIMAMVGCAHAQVAREPSRVDQASEAAVIRTSRAAQNLAIAVGDTTRVSSYWTDDVEIRRGLGQLVVGRNAYLRLFVPDSVAVERGTALVYERVPTLVEVSAQWPLAYEAGEWIAHLGGVSGPAVIRGRYSAQWVKRGVRWLIRGEVYVALSCAGVGCSYAAAP